MTVTYMTFMFGIALPLLFPIAAIAFFVLYVTEKLLITYYFRKPPMYDEKMNSAAIGILKYAPLFMMFFGFWALGNNQIFDNKPQPKNNQSDPVTTDHNVALTVNQALPMFLFGIVFFICLFFNDFFMSLLIKLRVCKGKEEDEVDEQLGTYYECLSSYQRKIWYLEEKHLQKNLKIQTIDDEALEKLRASKSGSKQIKDCFNYEILTNVNYADAFQFTPLELRDTPEEKEASDTIMRLLLMAYGSDEQGRAFKMKTVN